MRRIHLPEIYVGMGLAKGQAVSGNVGSANRIEFTSLGTVVNFSARLEKLCKPLNTPLVISMDIYNNLSQDIRDRMLVVRNAGVDNFKDVPAVAILLIANLSESVA